MIAEFRVENFRSFRTEQCLSFVAAPDGSFERTHCLETGHRGVPRLVRSAVLYGANASGKSNLVFALATMRLLVLTSTGLLEAQFREHYTPFLLDDSSGKKPTRFEVTLVLSGTRYQYGFAYDSERILGEWLLVYRSGKAQRWFEYQYDPEKGERIWQPFSVHFKGTHRGQREVWKANTSPRSLFLTQAAQSNSQELKPLFDWFANDLILLPAHAVFDLGPTLSRLEDAEYKRQVLRLMNVADIHVNDIKVEKREGVRIAVGPGSGKPLAVLADAGPVPDIAFCHKASDGRERWFDRRYESLGTQRLLSYAGPLLDALQNGKFLVIDEFDRSLHPLLTRHLLGLLHDPEVSKRGAQLFVTTHDTTLLDPDLVRRDQVWFVEKKQDQSSELYSLWAFRPRKHEAIERGYLRGRYGAIPFLGEFRF
ncbi:MAG: ATP-binding protein [Burkholderiales bacterium]|nr:ATP-binding protein [Burkholderiales bacterium]